MRARSRHHDDDDPVPGTRRPTATIAPAVEPRWPGAFPGPGVGTFVGRDAAVAETVGLLAPGTARLVTITGPGGVGKTRLARHSARVVAEAYAGRVLWVDLDPLDDPSLLLPEVAAARAVGEAKGRDVLEAVAASLEGGPALVILDPIDRVASGVSAVSALLERLPELTILATGRAPLGLPDEQLVVLEPLAL